MASGAAVAGEPLSRCSAVTMSWPSATPVKYGVVAPGKTIFGVVCPHFGTYYFQLPAECEVNYDDVHGICTGRVASFDRDRGDFTFEFPTPEGSESEVDTEWLPHEDFKILQQVQVAPGTDIFWPLRCLARGSALLSLAAVHSSPRVQRACSPGLMCRCCAARRMPVSRMHPYVPRQYSKRTSEVSNVKSSHNTLNSSW